MSALWLHQNEQGANKVKLTNVKTSEKTERQLTEIKELTGASRVYTMTTLLADAVNKKYAQLMKNKEKQNGKP